MVQELFDETYDLIKKNYEKYIPRIHMINGVKEKVLDYYDGGKEYNYLDFYNKTILIQPKTPCFNNKNSKPILLKTSKENPHNIEITSIFEQFNYNTTDTIMFCDTISCSCYERDHTNNLELISDDFKKFQNYFTIAFNFVKKGESLKSLCDFSLHIRLFLDNPINYKPKDYLNYNNVRILYYSKDSYKPYENPKYICELNKLGSYNCSLKKYLSIKSKEEYMRELSDYMYDIKEKISEGEYLNMQNILMDLKKYH